MSISKVSGETITAAFGGGYALQGSLTTAEFNPVSSTTYYGGDANNGSAGATGAQSRRIYIPKTGTIKFCYGLFYGVAQATSSVGTLSINVNNGAYTTIGTATHLTAHSLYSNTGLSISVTRGDYIEFKWVSPFYVPQRITQDFIIYIE